MVWKSIIAVLVVFVLILFASVRIRSTAHSEAIVQAPVAKVWSLFAEAEQIKKWWGPHKYSAPTVTNDLQVGGKFIFAMLSPSNDLNYNAGVYKEVVPNEKIVSDMWFSDEKGNPLKGDDIKVPGNWPDAVVVSVEFRSEGETTHVSITEEGIPLIMKFLAQIGWNQQFEKMNALLKAN